MKNSIEAKLVGMRNITSRASKFLMYSLTCLIICGFILIHKGHQLKNIVESPQIVTIDNKIQENDMSAVRFATLPFILAFKHLFIDRKE